MLFIYAAEEFRKLSNMNQLREADIRHIIETYDRFDDTSKYSRVVDHNELRENNWNLSVTRYVESFDLPDPVDIQQTWEALTSLECQRQESEKRLEKYLKFLGYEVEN